MSKPTKIGDEDMKKKRSSKSLPADKDDEFISTSSKNPKSFIGEIGMDNLDAETMEQILDHDLPSIIGSEDKIVSIPDAEPHGTADCVDQGNLNDANITSLNQRTENYLPMSNLIPKSAPVQRDY